MKRWGWFLLISVVLAVAIRVQANRPVRHGKGAGAARLMAPRPQPVPALPPATPAAHHLPNPQTNLTPLVLVFWSEHPFRIEGTTNFHTWYPVLPPNTNIEPWIPALRYPNTNPIPNHFPGESFRLVIKNP